MRRPWNSDTKAAVTCSVTGTEQDQNAARLVKELRSATTELLSILQVPALLPTATVKTQRAGVTHEQ